MQLSSWNPQTGNILSEPAEWSWWRVLSHFHCFVCTRSIIMSFADDVVWTARLSSIPGVRRTGWHWHLKARRLRVWFLRVLHGLLVPLWALSRLWSVKTGTAREGECGWLFVLPVWRRDKLLTPASWDPECSGSSGRTWMNVNVLCTNISLSSSCETLVAGFFLQEQENRECCWMGQMLWNYLILVYGLQNGHLKALTSLCHTADKIKNGNAAELALLGQLLGA